MTNLSIDEFKSIVEKMIAEYDVKSTILPEPGAVLSIETHSIKETQNGYRGRFFAKYKHEASIFMAYYDKDTAEISIQNHRVLCGPTIHFALHGD